MVENEKALIMLASLFNYCSEEQHKTLAKTYQDIVYQNENFIKLYKLIRNTSFYGKSGEDLRDIGIELLNRIISTPSENARILVQIQNIIFMYEKALKESTQYISSYRCDNQYMSAIEKRFESVVHELYLNLLNVICYYTTTFYGLNFTRSINVDINLPSLDLVKNLSSELTETISKASDLEKPCAWKIVRCFFGGSNIIHFHGVKLEYISWEEYNENSEWKSGRFISYGTNKNIICYGIGNISNATVLNGSNFLYKEVVTKIPLNILDKATVNYDSFDIISLINSAMNGKYFVADPENAVELLNRYFLMKKVKEHNQKQIEIYENSRFEIPKKFEALNEN